MAIPAAQIVSISPRVIQAGGTDLVLNGLILTESSRIPSTSIALQFASANDVGEYFGMTSNEYNAAVIYFNGYDNSFKKPRTLVIGRRVDADAAAWLRGVAVTATLAEFQAVTAGTLDITVDGTAIALTSIDLSSATSFSDVASAITTAFNTAATCTYDSLSNTFMITSATSGASSSITGTGSGTLESLLGFAADGVVMSQGMALMSVSENMAAIRQITENWACFAGIYTPLSNDEVLACSAWASGQGVQYLYVAWSDAVVMLTQSETTRLAYLLKESANGATAIVYGGWQYAAFILGAVASIDWERTNGTITLAFKSQYGLAADIDNGTDAQTLLAKNANFYGNYATRNDAFVFLYDGSMTNKGLQSSYNYIDPFINAIWFNNALQVAIMSGLSGASRVPYNEDGYSMIRAWCMDPINRAVKNGVINQGMTLSDAQKAQVIQEAGLDITSNLQTDGYYLQIQEASPSVRTNRESPNCGLWYTYAGSVHKIELASTLLI